MKITDDFNYKWKPSCAYHKINTFLGEQRLMGHKGGTDNSMKNALHVQQYGKRHLSGWNDEKIKSLFLTIKWILLSYVGLKALGRQAVS